MSVISKQGGREFHGSVFGYFRDYHLNSNEWYANKVGQDRVKNKFTYPGATISGPLLIPGTSFNKNRDKVFFFAGFEYFGQAPRHRLRQVLGADGGDEGRQLQQCRRGRHRFDGQHPSQLQLPGQHRPGQPDRSRRASVSQHVPEPEREPGR